MDILNLTAAELSRKIKSGEITSPEVTQAVLSRIKNEGADINAYITVTEDAVLKAANEVQAKIERGELSDSPLAGVPVAIKDNICSKNIKTTCGSKMLADFVPPYDATVVKKLSEAGAVIIGKLNLDEFAMGSSSQSSYFGSVENPWDTEKSPGGSSGGSVAAIASRLAYCTLGTDTGGSIRQPAAFCGVTGFKPTYGTVSRNGLIAHASSFDQIGPIASSAEDCAACFDIIAGYDKYDNTTADASRINGALLPRLKGNVKGLRIGLPKEYFTDEADSEILSAVHSAAEKLKELGAVLIPVTLPLTRHAIHAYHIISCAEASSNLDRFDGIRFGHRTENYTCIEELYENSRAEGFGWEIKRRILFGTYVLTGDAYENYYMKALRLRTLIKQSFERCFEECDVLLTPTVPMTVPYKKANHIDADKSYYADAYNVSVNLAGLPAVSMPCGFDSSGMPIGAQIIGPAYGDFSVLNTAHAFQCATDFHRQRPGGNKR